MAVRKRGATWTIDYYEPSGKRIRKAFKRKKDAVAEEAKRISLKAEDRYLDPKKEYTTTLDELITTYTENFKDQTTFCRAKRFFIKNFTEHFGADTRLSDITYQEIETYRNRLRRKITRRGKILSDASVNREMACLRHMLGKAKSWQMIERNPFEHGETLRLKENNMRVRFLNEDEIRALLKESPTHLRQIIICALNTGMRRGEILSLKWDMIRNGFIYLEKTKTGESRSIPVNDSMEKLFREIRQDQGLRSEYVFTFRGNPVNELKTAFQGAVRRAGIRNFRFHDLRHTAASQMVIRGASLKDVQEILGHKSMTMTLRYAHLSQERKKQAMNLLNGVTPGLDMLEEAQVTNSHKPKNRAQKKVSVIG